MKLKSVGFVGVEVYSRGILVAILPQGTEDNICKESVRQWVRECAHEPMADIPHLTADCFYKEKFEYEYTDTFGGETNYCWVKRGEVWAHSKAQALRLAKKALGLNGVRCRFNGIGWVPSGTCTILFVE
jgi:hypothetical protein